MSLVLTTREASINTKKFMRLCVNLKTYKVYHSVGYNNIQLLRIPSGTPENDWGLQLHEKYKHVFTDGHVSVQHHLLLGWSVLLLHSWRGEKHEKQLQDVQTEPKESKFQHFRGLNAWEQQLKIGRVCIDLGHVHCCFLFFLGFFSWAVKQTEQAALEKVWQACEATGSEPGQSAMIINHRAGAVSHLTHL